MILPDGEGCLSRVEIKATGHGGDIRHIFIGIGSERIIYPVPLDYCWYECTVAMLIIDNGDKYTDDIRLLGSEEEVWKVEVMVLGFMFGGQADFSKPGFSPLLNRDPNTICPKDPNTGYSLKLCSEDELGNLTLLIPDLSQTSQYQTKEEDARDWDCFSSLSYGSFIYYIAWSKDVEFVMNLSADWSMISLPVIPTDAKPSVLFPDAVVMYKFDNGLGYVRVQPNEELQVDTGYWILVYEDQNYVLTGQPINSYSKTIFSFGWEMISGGTSGAMPTTDICNLGVIYKFFKGAGYVRIPDTEVIDPGKGFWILFKEVADQYRLTVESIGSLSRLQASPEKIRFIQGLQYYIWLLDIRAIDGVID